MLPCPCLRFSPALTRPLRPRSFFLWSCRWGVPCSLSVFMMRCPLFGHSFSVSGVPPAVYLRACLGMEAVLSSLHLAFYHSLGSSLVRIRLPGLVLHRIVFSSLPSFSEMRMCFFFSRFLIFFFPSFTLPLAISSLLLAGILVLFFFGPFRDCR